MAAIVGTRLRPDRQRAYCPGRFPRAVRLPCACRGSAGRAHNSSLQAGAPHGSSLFPLKTDSRAIFVSAGSYSFQSTALSSSLTALPSAPSPLAILRETFGYPEFRGPQQAIVEHVIAGGDALVLMPTGGGKSLCYQIPAIVRQNAGHGVTIVISPLIALMHDQVGALTEAGVSAAFLNSTQTYEESSALEK